jgi:hypothetical protein
MGQFAGTLDLDPGTVIQSRFVAIRRAMLNAENEGLQAPNPEDR